MSLFLYLHPLRLRAKAAKADRNAGEGLGIPSDDYYLGLCHVSCRTTSRDSSIYIHIYIHIIYTHTYVHMRIPRRELPPRERETTGSLHGRHGARPCISRRFDRAGHYRRRNKSKSREQAWPFAICRRERKLHKSPRANNVLPRAGDLMSSGPPRSFVGGRRRAEPGLCREKWESRGFSVSLSSLGLIRIEIKWKSSIEKAPRSRSQAFHVLTPRNNRKENYERERERDDNSFRRLSRSLR